MDSIPIHAGGPETLVELDANHPGFNDAGYRARRNAIARLALDYRPGSPAPDAQYSAAEHYVWRTVWEKLAPLHERHAAEPYLRASERLQLDRVRIPQLKDVNEQLGSMYGFRMLPVAGLVSARVFLTRLSEGVFLSTQYIRHHSRPFYTPEPDIVHELVGHAATFADEEFAVLSREFGRAALRAQTQEQIDRIARVYWYTLEFGLVREGKHLKAYGAGLLSSYGEIGRSVDMVRHEDADFDKMAERPYDPTDYQPVLYVAEDFEQLTRGLSIWLESGRWR